MIARSHTGVVTCFCLAFALSCGGKAGPPAGVTTLADVAEARPAVLRAGRDLEGAERVARVRVYADHEHRSESVAEEISEIFDVMNQVLVPELGVRLEVAGVERWTRQAPAEHVEQMLAELEARDSGADVEWILGLVPALPATASATMHELVAARPLGRHLILRDYNEDAAAIERIPEDIRAARRQHKQAALLLHGLGHTLGALHVTSKELAVMFATYSKDISGFAQPNADNMRAIIDAWLLPSKERAPGVGALALLGYLDSKPRWPGWVAADYDALRARLDELAEAAKNAPQPSSGKRGVPPEVKIVYARVRGLARGGKLDEALGELGGLLSAYPAHLEFRVLACQLWLQKDGPSEAAAGHCMRVGELDPNDGTGEIALATAHVQRGQRAEAHVILTGLGERTAAMTENRDKTWKMILELYQGMQAVTWAEEAAARAPAELDVSEIRAWALSTRRRYGLVPAGSGHKITPDREAEYLALVRAVLDLTYGKKYNEARTAARNGLKTFPNGPGLLGALCDLEYRSRRIGAAHGYCTRALKHYDEASWPRYLLGIIELKKKRNKIGLKHLERAIAMDPELRQAYHALYQAYRRVGDKEAQHRLREGYFQRFGVPIPRK